MKNVKYLWDLDITNIECGWQEYYELAKNEFPNGEEMILLDNRPCFCNPVEYRNKLICSFKKNSKIAKQTFNNDDINFVEKLNILLRIDILLYMYLHMWTNVNYDSSIFNPDDICEDYFSETFNTYGLDWELYFNDKCFTGSNSFIDNLKLFRNFNK